MSASLLHAHAEATSGPNFRVHCIHPKNSSASYFTSPSRDDIVFSNNRYSTKIRPQGRTLRKIGGNKCDDGEGPPIVDAFHSAVKDGFEPCCERASYSWREFVFGKSYELLTTEDKNEHEQLM